MNKIALYILLIICYLGIAKSFSPTELGVTFVKDIDDLSRLVSRAPVSVILTDMHSTGFFIKSHYHKYKIVYGFSSYADEIVVRTSKEFSLKNKNNIGMSIFRRSGKDFSENSTPLPPGSIFIDDPSFGRWRTNPNSGIIYWKFYRAYKFLPKQLGWGKFSPTSKMYSKVLAHIGQNKPFHGLNNEFGTEGIITKEQFPDYFSEDRLKNIGFKELVLEYLKENFYHKI